MNQANPTVQPCRASTLYGSFLLLAVLMLSALQPAHAQVPALLPMKDAVAPTQAMSLDGVWRINTINKRIRIEQGRAYAVDGWVHLFTFQIQPGMVVIQNIAPVSAGHYTGDDLPLMGKWEAKMQNDRSLAVEVAGSLGPASYQLIPVQIDNDPWYHKEMVVAGLNPAPLAQQPPPPPMFLQPGGPAPSPGLVPTPEPSPPPPPFDAPPGPIAGIQPVPSPAPPPTVQPDPFPGVNPPPGVQPQPRPTPKPAPVRNPPIPANRCGGKGEKPCGKKGKVDAIRVGAAKELGCKGKNLYFTPHDGGQCWSCPEGFKRTTTPIHKPDSCKARGFKIGKKDRTNAKYVRPAFGCPKDQYQKGKSCYTCPAHSKKIQILGIFNPSNSCKMKPWCNGQLKPGPMPPKSLMDLGPAFTRRCDTKMDPKKTILPMAKHHMGLAGGINSAAALFAIEVARDKRLRKAIKSKDKAAIRASIKRMASFNKLKSMAQGKGYRSITIGVGGGVKAGLGLDQEMGVALDWDAGILFYSTSVVSKGFALSAGGGISLGVWTVDKDDLGGYAHGVSTSVPAGVVDVGAGAWFSYYPIEFLGLAYTAGAGVGAEIGVYNEALTQLYN